MSTLRKKTEPKRCPLGTVLKNGAIFGKKGTKTVPLWQSAPAKREALLGGGAILQKGTVLRTIKRCPR